MSAWIVSKKHIDALVTAYLHSQHFDKQRTSEENDAIGQMLWDENHNSVNYRYGDRTPTPVYKFRTCKSYTTRDGTRIKLDKIALCKLINCYMYQSNEHRSWPETEAYKFCETLRKRLIGDSEDYYMQKAYNDAPWGI